MYRIFLVEDDRALALELQRQLEQCGNEVRIVSDFRAVLDEVRTYDPQLVLMDIMLPYQNGYYWTAEIRKFSTVPIVFLSSASDGMNIVMAINMGGDDFIAKPVEPMVLQSKVQAILLTLGIGLFAALLVWAIWLEVHNQDLFGKALYVVVPVQAFVAVELAFIIMYMYALLARFEMTNTEVLKYAFLMSNKHILTTLLCLLLLAGITAATFLWNLGVGLFAYGIFFYIAGLLLERVFRNYMPDEEAEEAGEDGQDEVTDDEGLKAREAKEQAKKEEEEKAKSQAEKERVAILKRYTDISETESDRDKDGR